MTHSALERHARFAMAYGKIPRKFKYDFLKSRNFMRQDKLTRRARRRQRGRDKVKYSEMLTAYIDSWAKIQGMSIPKGIYDYRVVCDENNNINALRNFDDMNMPLKNISLSQTTDDTLSNFTVKP